MSAHLPIRPCDSSSGERLPTRLLARAGRGLIKRADGHPNRAAVGAKVLALYLPQAIGAFPFNLPQLASPFPPRSRGGRGQPRLKATRWAAPHASAIIRFCRAGQATNCGDGRSYELSYVLKPFLSNWRCGRQPTVSLPRPARRREFQNGGSVSTLFHGSQISGEDHGAAQKVRGEILNV